MEKEVYKGQIIRVTEEKIGNVVWERAYVPHGVVVFPVTDEGKILLIEEKRPHENPQVRIKAVSGILEPHKGTPEENAQREMQEEIGLKAGKLELLMHLKGSGTINHEQWFFIARDLTEDKLPNPDGEDVILGIHSYDPEELMELLMQDKIRWSMSAMGMIRLIETLRRGAKSSKSR